MKFKDKCDLCGNWNYCKGYDNKVLCPNCINKLDIKKVRVNLQLSFFEEVTNDNIKSFNYICNDNYINNRNIYNSSFDKSIH